MIQRVTILTLMLVLAAACGRFPGIGVKPVSADTAHGTQLAEVVHALAPDAEIL